MEGVIFMDEVEKLLKSDKVNGVTKNAFYEKTVECENLDGSTSRCITRTGSRSQEAPYLKLYLGTMLAFNGIHNIPVDVIIALGNCIQPQYVKEYKGTSSDTPENIVFHSDKYNKNKMAEILGVKLSMIDKYIHSMVKCGILIPTDCKGAYYVNPFIISSGYWSGIRELRSEFDYIDGKWKVVAEVEEDNFEGTIDRDFFEEAICSE